MGWFSDKVIGGTTGQVLDSVLDYSYGQGPVWDGIKNPNSKTNEAQARADALARQLKDRRAVLEDREGRYHRQRDTEYFDAAQIDPQKRIRTSEGIRGQIMDLANQPSVAMDQHRLATDRGLKQSMALAASQRNPAALRQALDAQAGMQQQSALQSSLVRSQEAQRQQAGLTGLRAQDIGVSTAQRQLDLQVAEKNQAAEQERRKYSAEAFNRSSAERIRNRIIQDRDRGNEISRTFGHQVGTTGISSDIAQHQSKVQEKRTEGATTVLGKVLEYKGSNPFSLSGQQGGAPTQAGGPAPRRAGIISKDRQGQLQGGGARPAGIISPERQKELTGGGGRSAPFAPKNTDLSRAFGAPRGAMGSAPGAPGQSAPFAPQKKKKPASNVGKAAQSAMAHMAGSMGRSF